MVTYLEGHNGTLPSIGPWVNRLQHLEGHVHGASIYAVTAGALEDKPKAPSAQQLALLDDLWPHQVAVTQVQKHLQHKPL